MRPPARALASQVQQQPSGAMKALPPEKLPTQKKGDKVEIQSRGEKLKDPSYWSQHPRDTAATFKYWRAVIWKTGDQEADFEAGKLNPTDVKTANIYWALKPGTVLAHWALIRTYDTQWGKYYYCLFNRWQSWSRGYQTCPGNSPCKGRVRVWAQTTLPQSLHP